MQRALPHRLNDQLDDLVQTALIKTLDILERRAEANASPPTSYLMKVAYTVALDEIRRHERRREVPMGDPSVDPPAAGPDPEQVRASAALGEAIGRCLAGIVTARRRAVALHLLGYSGPEASATLGWAPKRVNNLVYRGLADLRRCLEAKGLRP
jgi:RNA polymerase sigma-70 factor (ECF subfamily)